MGFRSRYCDNAPKKNIVSVAITYRRLPHAANATQQTLHAEARVQRLVAKALDVERETALVVGSDNVLLGFVNMTRTNTP